MTGSAKRKNPLRGLTNSWGRTAGTVYRAIVPLALYDLLFKILGALALTPLTAFALDRLVAVSGSASVTNTDITRFLLSPWGLLFLVLSGSFAFAGIFAEQAGLMHITVLERHRQRPDWLAALGRVLGALPRLLATAATQVGFLLLWFLPLSGIGVGSALLLLGSHDINWYLSERPIELLVAIAIGAVLAAIALAVLGTALVRWALAVPVCLYEGLYGRAALRRSRELIRGRHRRTALLVLGWVLGTIGAAALVLGLLELAAGFLLRQIEGGTAQILTTTLILGVMALAGAALSFVAFAGYSITVIHLYGECADILDRARSTDAIPRRRLLLPGLIVALTVATGVSTLSTWGLMDDLALGREVAVTAHRGSSIKAPENSLSAIRAAIEDGADFAEIDIQETADGTLVLLHDTDLMRIAGLNRKLWEVRYDEIRGLDAGTWFSPKFAGEPIATLKQAIDLARGRIKLNIELKFNGHDQRLAESAAELIRAEGFTDQCVITSLEQSGLRRVRELAPEIPVGQIVSLALGDPRHLNVDLLSIQSSLATPDQIRTNRAAGLETHVWTINDRDAMERMIERGVDNIITDQPALLRQVIDDRSARSDGELLLLALSARLRE